MWFLVVAMLVVLVLAGLVVVYVAFPHRGEDVPYVGWLGRLLRKGVETAPTLDNTAGEAPPGPDPDESSLALDLTSLDHRRPEGRRRGA
jgi:hypothetical protein